MTAPSVCFVAARRASGATRRRSSLVRAHAAASHHSTLSRTPTCCGTTSCEPATAASLQRAASDPVLACPTRTRLLAPALTGPATATAVQATALSARLHRHPPGRAATGRVHQARSERSHRSVGPSPISQLHEHIQVAIKLTCIPGSGKTAIFTSLVHRLPPLIHPETNRTAARVLILVGSIVLAQQAALAVRTRYPTIRVEIEQGAHHASGHADVTVSTYQTLVRQGKFGQRLDKFDPATYKAVIVDEVSARSATMHLRLRGALH